MKNEHPTHELVAWREARDGIKLDDPPLVRPWPSTAASVPSGIESVQKDVDRWNASASYSRPSKSCNPTEASARWQYAIREKARTPPKDSTPGPMDYYLTVQRFRDGALHSVERKGHFRLLCSGRRSVALPYEKALERCQSRNKWEESALRVPWSFRYDLARTMPGTGHDGPAWDQEGHRMPLETMRESAVEYARLMSLNDLREDGGNKANPFAERTPPKDSCSELKAGTEFSPDRVFIQRTEGGAWEPAKALGISKVIVLAAEPAAKPVTSGYQEGGLVGAPNKPPARYERRRIYDRDGSVVDPKKYPSLSKWTAAPTYFDRWELHHLQKFAKVLDLDGVRTRWEYRESVGEIVRRKVGTLIAETIAQTVVARALADIKVDASLDSMAGLPPRTRKEDS